MLDIMWHGTRKERHFFCFHPCYRKTHPKLEGTLLRTGSSCGLPKITHSHILSKVAPIVWVDEDAKFTRLICNCLGDKNCHQCPRTWPTSPEESRMLYNWKPLVLIHSSAGFSLWFDSGDLLCSLSPSSNTEHVEARRAYTHHSAVSRAPVLMITCFVLRKCK